MKLINISNLKFENNHIISKHNYYYGNVGGADIVINTPSPSSSSSTTTTIYTPSRTNTSGADVVVHTPSGPALIDPVTSAIIPPTPQNQAIVGTTTTTTTYTPSRINPGEADVVVHTPSGPALIDPITQAITTESPTATLQSWIPINQTTIPETAINYDLTNPDLSSADNRIIYVYNGLINRGWSDTGARAVIANMVNETTGLNPYAVGDNGLAHGLFQWHDNRWTNYLNYVDGGKYDFENGGIQTAIDSQLDFMTHEVKTTPDYSGIWQRVNNNNDVNDAINYYCRIYEGAGFPGNRTTTDEDTSSVFRIIDNAKSNSSLPVGQQVSTIDNPFITPVTTVGPTTLVNEIDNQTSTSQTTGSGISSSYTPHPSSEANLYIYYNKIDEIITQLKKCKEDLKNCINELKTKDLKKIRNSWNAKEADIYLQKVDESIAKISSIQKALQLLIKTYKKVQNNSKSTQNSIKSIVDNI